MQRRSEIATGTLLAGLAALCFGVTTPVVDRAGHGLGPLTIAALLYAGAAIIAAAMAARGRPSGAPLARAHLARLLAIVIFGAAAAPVLYVVGLRQAGPTATSLLLTLETAFTVALAALVLHEPPGRRLALAATLMMAGGALVALDGGGVSSWSALGALAVAAATACWAIDNTLTRKLADLDPWLVIRAKAGLGATATASLALMRGEPAPALAQALVLLACGASGYGLSLRLYLLAQRRVGAARTASVFSLAPFVGAAASWALGDRAGGAGLAAGMFLLAAGVALHATERHAHAHVHDATEHEHAHRHDDGHHDHVHSPPVAGEHTHAHRHERVEHSHEHGSDAHHRHEHG